MGRHKEETRMHHTVPTYGHRFGPSPTSWALFPLSLSLGMCLDLTPTIRITPLEGLQKGWRKNPK
jgi:hypothetical protein